MQRNNSTSDKPWEMHMQLFAEGGNAEGNGGGNGGDGGGEGGAEGRKAGGNQEKTLTQAEVDALVEKRLARAMRDHEKALSEARAAGQKEGEERARMSEADRLKADREKAERAAGEREQALRKREAEITRRELRAEAVDALIEKGLPKELGELLDYTDADACKASIASVEKVFRAAVQAGIDERIRKSGGSVGAGGTGAGKPDYAKMSDAEYYAAIGQKK